jgi:hypothetical protein
VASVSATDRQTPTEKAIQRYKLLAANSQLPESMTGIINQMIATQETLAKQLAEQQKQLCSLIEKLLPTTGISRQPVQTSTAPTAVDERAFPPLRVTVQNAQNKQKATGQIHSNTPRKLPGNGRNRGKGVPVFQVGNPAQLATRNVAATPMEAEESEAGSERMEVDKTSTKRRRQEEDSTETDGASNAKPNPTQL